MPLYKQESYLDMMGVTLSIDKNYYDIRFKIRAKKLAPIIDNFIEYVDREIKNALPRGPLGKALEDLMPCSNKIPENMKIKGKK